MRRDYCAESLKIVEGNACFEKVLLRCFDCFLDDCVVCLALHIVSVSLIECMGGTTAELDITTRNARHGAERAFIRCGKPGFPMEKASEEFSQSLREGGSTSPGGSRWTLRPWASSEE